MGDDRALLVQIAETLGEVRGSLLAVQEDVRDCRQDVREGRDATAELGRESRAGLVALGGRVSLVEGQIKTRKLRERWAWYAAGVVWTAALAVPWKVWAAILAILTQ